MIAVALAACLVAVVSAGVAMACTVRTARLERSAQWARRRTDAAALTANDHADTANRHANEAARHRFAAGRVARRTLPELQRSLDSARASLPTHAASERSGATSTGGCISNPALETDADKVRSWFADEALRFHPDACRCPRHRLAGGWVCPCGERGSLAAAATPDEIAAYEADIAAHDEVCPERAR